MLSIKMLCYSLIYVNTHTHQLTLMDPDNVKMGTQKHNSTNLPPTSRSLPIALARAREKVMAPIREMLSESGITEQQWRVLRALSESGALDATKLADRACLLLPSLTRIIQTMLEKGYVSRSTDKEDRRRQLITITASGQTIIDDNRQQATAISSRFISALGEQRYEELLDSLQALDELE